ncbi:MAG TPA: response regulator [Terriglobia bacterium]|nr:response regulator [Terriglobia bacterium]
MAKILIAGLESWLKPALAQGLPGSSLVTLPGPDASIVEAAPESADLLILNHNFAAPATPEFLARLRQTLPEIPVIYCLDPDAQGKLVRRLIIELKVSEIIFHPVDAGALIQKVAALLQLPCGPMPGIAGEDGSIASHSVLKARLADLWKRSRAKMLERVEVLEMAGAALLEGTLEPALRSRAEGEAHKLAGSLGTFGLHAATGFAREIEHALRSDSLLAETQAHRFSELAAALRAEIERARDLEGGEPPCECVRCPLLLVTSDAELAAGIIEQAAARGWRCDAASDLAEARAAISGLNPAAALVDIGSLGRREDAVAFLGELSNLQPPLPALILTSGGNLMDRVEVVRAGGRGFFPRTLPPAEIVEAALAALDRLFSPSARVLAVDDDPAVLDLLAALLGPAGISCTGLSDPLCFWEALEGAPPDLLILDIQMPSVSGIELCRAMRNDPRWAATPVIFLTALTDSRSVESVFNSGADDFVAKPIVGPELITRIMNRLERTRLLRNAAEADPLSGLANRLKFRRVFADFLRLADRHGQPMGLALLRVDELSGINEAHGAAAGDEVVRQLGSHLRHEFRSEEIAARRAANDFAVGLYGLDRPGSVRRVDEVLHTFSERRFTGASAEDFRVTLSGGVAAYPEDAAGLDGLLRAAAEARLRASESGGGRLLTASAAYESRGGVRLIDLAIVTSDEATVSVLLHILQPDGYRVRALRHGLAAARALCGPDRTLRPRVMLIDLELPGIDGLTLLGQLAGEDALEHSRVIALSSAATRPEAALALDLGAEDYIARPVDLPVLAARLRRALESPEPQSSMVRRQAAAGNPGREPASPRY